MQAHDLALGPHRVPHQLLPQSSLANQRCSHARVNGTVSLLKNGVGSLVLLLGIFVPSLCARKEGDDRIAHLVEIYVSQYTYIQSIW